MHKRSCDRKIFENCEQRSLVDLWGCRWLFATTKRAPFVRFFCKTRANTQQALPVQTGLYRQEINDANRYVSERNLTEFNLVR